MDFRLICATHRDLMEEVEAGRFREDLFYRLRVLELHLPPLRDRLVDIPFLLRRFLGEFIGAAAADEAVKNLPATFLRHRFPGNVRELRNVAERYAALHDVSGDWNQLLDSLGASSSKSSVAFESSSRSNGIPLIRNTRLSAGEILSALEACGYHRGHTAEKLGVTRRALQYRLAGMQTRLQ